MRNIIFPTQPGDCYTMGNNPYDLF